MRRGRATLMVLAVVSLTGCTTLDRGWASLRGRPEKQASAAKTQDTVIGIVESVNPEQKFVLVRMDVRMPVTAGTRLETRPHKGLKAVLTVTPERKQSFVSADIVDGFPSPGDLVVMPPGAEAPAAAPPAAPGAEPATSEPLPATAPSTPAPEGGLPPPVG